MKTYEEQWQKITSAYLNNELNPYASCACFIGNLLEGGTWSLYRQYVPDGNSVPFDMLGEFFGNYMKRCGLENLYTIKDIVDMENNFLKIASVGYTSDFPRIPNDKHEETLYEAMVSTLEMLKQIHIRNGEDVDNSLVLKRRRLQTA